MSPVNFLGQHILRSILSRIGLFTDTLVRSMKHFSWTRKHHICWCVGLKPLCDSGRKFGSVWSKKVSLQRFDLKLSTVKSQKGYHKYLWDPTDIKNREWHPSTVVEFRLTGTNITSPPCRTISTTIRLFPWVLPVFNSCIAAIVSHWVGGT